MRTLGRIFLAGSLGAALLFFVFLPSFVDNHVNARHERLARPASARARVLYDKLFVADLHADSLLWGRDLLKRNDRGHVDIPRLLEARIGLQVFTVVTKVPRGINIEFNDDSSDLVIWLALSQAWPPGTWRSLTARALCQAERLHRVAEKSGGRFSVIESRRDLDAYVARRADDPVVTAGLLGVEGAHALDGKLENVDTLFAAGFRMMAPTHFFDTEVGGSAHGVRKEGLTALGRNVIRRMEDLGMIVDLAHASSATIDDVLAIASKPVVFSHGGVKGTCDNTRNLSDDQIIDIAATGGVIGIGFWETAVCGDDPASIARAIRYAADLVGSRHVGLGSDFDGAITAPFDVVGLIELVDELLDEGFGDDDIGAIMGRNVLRVMREALPAD
ncbi:MAG: dipeptidase [Candidatus Binatia bacterium]